MAWIPRHRLLTSSNLEEPGSGLVLRAEYSDLRHAGSRGGESCPETGRRRNRRDPALFSAPAEVHGAMRSGSHHRPPIGGLAPRSAPGLAENFRQRPAPSYEVSLAA